MVEIVGFIDEYLFGNYYDGFVTVSIIPASERNYVRNAC